MSLDALIENLPDYAKDLRLNFSSLVRNQTELTPQQLYGTLVASAVASRNPELLQATLAEAKDKLSPEALNAAKGAAAIMGMNNIYYRFLHLVEDPEYAQMPARLRMNVIGNPGIDKQDFELLSLAVSAINGCGTCVASHERTLRKHEMSREAVQSAVRIAATVHAVARVLENAASQAATAEAQAAA